MGERPHEIGRKFAYKIKDVLERTGKFSIPFVSYEATSEQTSMETFEGEKKQYDLKGSHISSNEENFDVFIESKDDSNTSRLKNEYKKFLRESFSVWIKKRTAFMNWKARFLFISSHPFNCSNFNDLKQEDFLERCLRDNEVLLEKLEQTSRFVRSEFLDYVDIIFLTPSTDFIITDETILINSVIGKYYSR